MTKSQVTQTKPSFYDEFCITCVTLLACVLLMALIVLMIGLLVWDGFAIKAMIQTTNLDVKRMCSKSNLWSYVGSVMIYILCAFMYFISAFKVHFTKDNIVCLLSGLYISIIIFSSWGSLEIFGNSCPTILTNTLLYKLGYVILMFQYLLFSVLPIIIIIYICRKITKLNVRDSCCNIETNL